MTSSTGDTTIHVPGNVPVDTHASPASMSAAQTREFRSEPQNPDMTNIVGSDIKGLADADSAPQDRGLGPNFPAHESANSAIAEKILQLPPEGLSTNEYSKYQFQTEGGQRAWLMHQSGQSSGHVGGIYTLWGTLAKVQANLALPMLSSPDGASWSPQYVLLIPGDVIPEYLKLTPAASLD